MDNTNTESESKNINTEPSPLAPRRKRRPPQRHRLPRQTQEYLTTAQAAVVLGIGPEALQARARRHARREDGKIVARLGPGITAMKFGVTWRFLIVPVE